jgi:hypothetical protein
MIRHLTGRYAVYSPERAIYAIVLTADATRALYLQGEEAADVLAELSTAVDSFTPSPAFPKPADLLDQLISAYDDSMAPATDDDAIPYLIARLRSLNPDDRGLLYSAERNASAEEYRDLIRHLRPHVTDGRYVGRDNLFTWLANIADACKGDGADRGFIPLIAGEPRAVWDLCYACLQRHEAAHRANEARHDIFGVIGR